MLLIHDLVEIDAGDNSIFSTYDPLEQAALEQRAADRIFGMLPLDQSREFKSLWIEFEAAESNDALFAKSIDRTQPVISNLENGGNSWTKFNVTADQLDGRVGVKIRRGAPVIWESIKDRVSAWFKKSE